jgi:hypothetical protein
MEAGKTYKIRYVYEGDNVVKESTFLFRGDMYNTTTPYIVIPEEDKVTLPGRLQILSIDEQEAAAKATK